MIIRWDRVFGQCAEDDSFTIVILQIYISFLSPSNSLVYEQPKDGNRNLFQKSMNPSNPVNPSQPTLLQPKRFWLMFQFSQLDSPKLMHLVQQAFSCFLKKRDLIFPFLIAYIENLFQFVLVPSPLFQSSKLHYMLLTSFLHGPLSHSILFL